jgi:hypothetical protein
METATGEIADFPRSPNAFPFTKAAIKDIVRANVRLGPMRFGRLGVVAAFDEKTANVVIAITANNPIRKGEMKLHPVTVARLVIVKTNPQPGRVKLGTHRAV